MSENSKNYDLLEMKMEAMKKVFADMMLNTSKVAAERLMSAEHKSLRIQEELVFSKEDSARMMLHLTNSYKSQIQEAEARSLDKQNKIDELEAQLGEAEGIIVDLRDELRQLHEKLEAGTNNEKSILIGCTAGAKECDHDCLLQGNALNFSTTTLAADEKFAFPGVASQHPISINSENFQVMDSYSFPGKSNLDDTSAGDEDYSSLIMQDSAADLCRNGYTQRIRAFDRNLSAMKPPTFQANDPQSIANVPLETCEAKVRNNREYPVTEKACTARNLVKCQEQSFLVCPFKTDEKTLNARSSNKDQAINCPHRSARKNTRYREAIASLRGKPRKKYTRSRKLSLLDQLRASSSRLNVQSVKNRTRAAQQLFGKKICARKSVDPKPESDSMNSCHEVLPGGELEEMVCGNSGKGGDGEEAREDQSKRIRVTSVDEIVDSELFNVPVFRGFGNFHHQTVTGDLSSDGKMNNKVSVVGKDAEEPKEALSKKIYPTSVDELVESGLVDVPVIEGFDSSPNQAETAKRSRPIRYTFHRKCKKNVSYRLNGNFAHEKDRVGRLEDGTLIDVSVAESNGSEKELYG